MNADTRNTGTLWRNIKSIRSYKEENNVSKNGTRMKVLDECNIVVSQTTDMPHGTDCPYPIRILAFFEMIRPYHVGIRISGNLRENIVRPVCSKTKVLSSTQLQFPRLNVLTNMIDRRFHR